MPVVLVGPEHEGYRYPEGVEPGAPVMVGKERVAVVLSPEGAALADQRRVRAVNFAESGQTYRVPILFDSPKIQAVANRIRQKLGPDATIHMTIVGKEVTAYGEARLRPNDSQPSREDLARYGEYSRALDAQLEMLQFCSTPRGIEWIGNLATEDFGNARYWIRAILTTVKFASPFYVTPTICDYLRATTSELHVMPLTEEMLPCQVGFALFDKPFLLPDVPMDPYVEDMEGEEPWHDDIHALGWVRSELGPGPGQDQPTQGVVFTYFARPQSQSLRPAMSFWVAFGDTQLDYIRSCIDSEREKLGFLNDEDEPRHDHWQKVRRLRLNYTYGFLRFLQERILVPSRPQQANRATRKRVAHAHIWEEEPLIRIVEFRKTEHAQSLADGSHEGWHIMHEFTVGEGTGGFYNTYHTKNGPIRKKIEPYVKGHGLPPKRQQATINVVRR